MKNPPIVRAIDVGYGHVKWSEGRDDQGEIIADTFPSQALLATEGEFQSEIMLRRDTVLVPVSGRIYEVGRHVRNAVPKNAELEQLDENFSLSDGYSARLYGAFNYMLPTLPEKKIDYLMLGLPLTTLNQNSKALMKRFLGEHTVNQKGETITVENCAVYPQPLGGYAAYLQRPHALHSKPPMALIIDVGYNTVDWLTCEGMVANPAQSSAVERGMSGFLREVAKSVIKTTGFPASESGVVRMLDLALISGDKFQIAGNDINLEPHMKAGAHILEEAAQAVRNHVGFGQEIQLVIISGGGAALYAPWIQKKFPAHKVVTLPDSALANVRGFHQFGEWIAESARRATHSPKSEDVKSA